jgi:TetR/AcrR family tetracycline transcriptional repressor
MSIVPYREIKRRPKRRPLDQAQVVRAALALLDDVGLDALTMRRLSERLGIKAASLYRHVRNKDELLQLLADEINGEIPLTRSTGTWQSQVLEMARNVRKGLLAHRDAAQLLAITMPFGPRRLRHIESLLRILRSAGLSGRDATRAAYHFNNLVTEFVADESRFASMARTAASSRRTMYAQARKLFKSLPREEYPVIVELADDLSEDDPDGLFEFGVQVWLRGLEELSSESGSGSRG